MRFDIISNGKVVHFSLAKNMKEAIDETEQLIDQGKFKLEMPQYIRTNPFMTYKYYNMDGTENYTETRRHLIEAGFENYLK